MDPKKVEELRKHLKAALACLDADYSAEDGEDSPAPGADEGDDELGDKSLRMKMAKYK